MTETQPVRNLPAPPDGTRVETGPVQFGDDWPGLFVRGDNAFALTLHIRRLAERLKGHSDAAVADSLQHLEDVAETIEREVIVHPTPHQPERWHPVGPPSVQPTTTAEPPRGQSSVDEWIGKGASLWDSDEEFEQFLENIRKIRRGE